MKLKRFVDPDFVQTMLDMARANMGDDGDSNPVREGADPLAYFNVGHSGGLSNPVLRPLINEVGKNAGLLLRRRQADGSSMGDPVLLGLLRTQAAGQSRSHGTAVTAPRPFTRTSSPSPWIDPAA